MPRTNDTKFIMRVKPEVLTAAREMAESEGRSLAWVLTQAMKDYAAGMWVPKSDPLPQPIEAPARKGKGTKPISK